MQSHLAACVNCDAPCEKHCIHSDKPIQINRIAKTVISKYSNLPDIDDIDLMGQTDNEWITLAKRAEQSGADIIELNFSCPHMNKSGMGSDVGQNVRLVKKLIGANCAGCHLCRLVCPTGAILTSNRM